MAIDIILKQANNLRTAYLVPHLGVSDFLAAFCYEWIRIEGVRIGCQFVIIRVFALILTVGLTAFSGLSYSNFC